MLLTGTVKSPALVEVTRRGTWVSLVAGAREAVEAAREERAAILAEHHREAAREREALLAEAEREAAERGAALRARGRGRARGLRRAAPARGRPAGRGGAQGALRVILPASGSRCGRWSPPTSTRAQRDHRRARRARAGGGPTRPIDDQDAFTIIVDGEIAGWLGWYEETDPDYRHGGLDIFLAPRFQGRGSAARRCGSARSWLIEERGHHRLIIDPAAATSARSRPTRRSASSRSGSCAATSAGPTASGTTGC